MSLTDFGARVGSSNSIGSAAFKRGLGRGTDDDGLGRLGNVAVDVDTQVDLDDVAGHKHGCIVAQRRKVAGAVVDRDARGEGKTLLDRLVVVILFVVDFGRLQV